MTRELIFTRDGQVEFRPIDPKPLASNEVRVRAHLTGIRHGCDLRRLAEHRETHCTCDEWRPEGWGVGEVIEIGDKVDDLTVGDLIHGPMHHGDIQTVERHHAHPLQWMKKEFAVFTDPGIAALARVHAAGVRFGDRVAIVGAGAVGLMAMQYALLSGAQRVSVLDRWPNRLRAAQRLGAEGVELCEDDCETVMRESADGADIVIDLTGSDKAMAICAEALRQGARLAIGSGCSPQRIEPVRRICETRGAKLIHTKSCAKSERLEIMVIDSIASGRVIVWPILTHLTPFTEAAHAYEAMRSAPDAWIKACFYYDDE